MPPNTKTDSPLCIPPPPTCIRLLPPCIPGQRRAGGEASSEHQARPGHVHLGAARGLHPRKVRARILSTRRRRLATGRRGPNTYLYVNILTCAYIHTIIHPHKVRARLLPARRRRLPYWCVPVILRFSTLYYSFSQNNSR